jgi:hypothetical protein
MAASSLRSIGEGELASFDPTAGEDAILSLTWLAGKLVQIDKKIGEFTYRKTLVWTGDQLDSVTKWVKL